MTRKIIILWIVNEIIQLFNSKLHLFQENIFNFLLNHLSSFFGGYISMYLIYHFNIKKKFPLIILLQVLYNLSVKKNIDILDIIFLTLGMSLFYLNEERLLFYWKKNN